MKKKLSELKNWEHNPRKILDHDYARLKEQIMRLGAYKPLLVTDDGIVIGGNMRLRAFRDLGITEIECNVIEFIEVPNGVQTKVAGVMQSTVFATKQQAMIEYAVSDNDSAGYTDEQMLTELLYSLPKMDALPIQNYAVYTIPATNLAEIVKSISPETTDEEDQGKLDETNKRCAGCSCGDEHDFIDAEKER